MNEDLRERILSLVSEYVHNTKEEKFIPGKTWIKYAGRVFDEDEYLLATNAVLDGWITAGKYSEDFESALAEFLGVYSSLIVNSGSSANLVALSTLTSPYLGSERLKRGDEVITVAAGFPTTVNPIIQNNLVPVFVDIEIGTYNMKMDEVEEAIGDKTKAIMVAHTLGNPVDLDGLKRIAKEHNLYFVEDNCDALGSEYDSKLTGTFGDLSTLSFYPAHHITMGEGGAVSTNDPKLERIARSYRDWGRDCYCETGASDTCGMRFSQQFGTLPFGYDHKYVYSHIGYNLKATDIQAAIGLAQLKKVKSFIDARRKNFNLLYERLKEFDDVIVLPKHLEKAKPSWFAFPITVRKNAGFSRDELVRYLESRKIMTRPIFAGNLTRQPAYIEVEKRNASTLEATDNVMNNSFFIGVYPGITEEMIEYEYSVFAKFIEDHK